MSNRKGCHWVLGALVVGVVPSWLAACTTSTDNVGEGSGGATSATSGQGPSGTGTGGAGVGSGTSGAGETASTSGGGTTGSGGAGATAGSGGGTGGSGGDASAPCPASATLKPGDTTVKITVDGLERSFLVHAPPGYDGVTRAPIVFDFHGLSGNSNQQKNLSGWDDVADAEGFLAVYPQGVSNAWNAGLCCGDDADDVAFVRAIITKLESEACIDTKRVYASGCSNGGGMSYKLACKAADVIAGVAPVDFDCVDGAGCGDCSPTRPVTVVQFRGTNDSLVPYDGGNAFAGAKENFATWGELNTCTGSPAALSERAACETYPTCGTGAETVLCTVQGGTHCGSYNSFMIPELAWQVLQRHALP
ncbi:PHB depolymerase family esterase [Sorangium sp. So ce726]|uniref:alpha/beta hydrolase family esterase n=1 Tax=Sorangium sp. So ce726 TaxID=3133319 RepID=UPI003F5DC685